MGRRQTRWPGTHDADCLCSGDRYRRGHMLSAELIHDMAFEVANLDGTVAAGPPARRLTRGITNAPTNRTEGVGRGNRFKCLFITPFPDVADVRRSIRSDRTSHLARRRDIMQVARVVRVARWCYRDRDPMDVVNTHVSRLLPRPEQAMRLPADKATLSLLPPPVSLQPGRLD